MSSYGIGEDIAGLLFDTAAVSFYVAKGVTVGTFKLAAFAGREVHKAYVRHEEKRREALQQELIALKDAVGEEAIRRHETLMRAEADAEALSQAAREAALKQAEAFEARIREASEEHEQLLSEMKIFLENSERHAEALVRAETEAFNHSLEESCKACEREAVAYVNNQKKALEEKLASSDVLLDAREAAQRNYARRALEEGKALMRVLESHYDCAALASADLAAAEGHRRNLEAALESDSTASTAMSAGLYTQQMQMLQIHLEVAQAQVAHTRMQLDQAAGELQAIIDATHELKGKDDSEDVAYYVDEELNASFWSEGRLDALWLEARQKIDTLRSLDDTQLDLARGELVKAAHLRDRISAEYVRTRKHVASRIVMDNMLQQADASMLEDGWLRMGEPDYAVINPATGRYEVCDDPRGDLMIRYERENGDARVMILRNHYDGSRGEYMQSFMRICHEQGEVDEGTRQRDDEAFNRAMMRRTGRPGGAGLHCDRSTMGQKLNV